MSKVFVELSEVTEVLKELNNKGTVNLSNKYWVYHALVDKCEVCNMTPNEYQNLAMRTAPDVERAALEDHATRGMSGEVGEIHSLYQKIYQGHEFDKEHAKKEVGDLLWFIAEYCYAMGWKLEDVMQANIDKLRARYPEGFDAERSLHRAEGDV